MSFALLFPGQGAQAPGLLHSLPQFEAVHATLQEASEHLGFDVLQIDTNSTLAEPVASQLSLLIAGIAFTRTLHAANLVPSAAAGMSVGAFAAAVAAGSLDLPAALRFVRRRAELMHEVFPAGYGMAVIEGLREPALQALLGHTSLAIANFNAPLQFVVSGELAQLNQLLPLAVQEGAHTAALLRMGTASHTPMLASAAEELLRFAQDIPIAVPRIPIFSNRNARPLMTAAAVREDLAFNMAHPVRWHDVQSALHAFDPALLLEAPPGHTLTHLAQNVFRDTQALAAGDLRWDVLMRAAQRAG